MSVDPLSHRCPDRSPKIPAPVGNRQNQTCVGGVARRAVIENIRTHPYTRAVCLETARMFEHRAAKHLVEAQDWADQGRREFGPGVSNHGQTCPAACERLAPSCEKRLQLNSTRVTAMSVIDVGELRADISKTRQRRRSE